MSMLEWLTKLHISRQPSLGCITTNSGVICSPEFPEISAFVNDNHTRREKTLHARLQRAQEDGQIKSDTNIHALSRYINGVMQGMGVIARGRPDNDTLNDMIKYTTSTLADLLGLWTSKFANRISLFIQIALR